MTTISEQASRSGGLIMFSVCVYCASSGRIAARYLDLAEEVGNGIAVRGWRLVSGGESVSMMGRVASAARAGGGHTVGVVARPLLERADHQSDELVVTEEMGERKRRMAHHADAFLALPGGLGTCEELLEAWVGRLVGSHAKPLVVLDPDGHFEPFFDWLEDLCERGFAQSSALSLVTRTRTVDDAIDACAGRAGSAAQARLTASRG